MPATLPANHTIIIIITIIISSHNLLLSQLLTLEQHIKTAERTVIQQYSDWYTGH